MDGSGTRMVRLVVDGEVTEYGLADISSLGVETIELVKGREARERWGEAAEFGVVRITTRREPR